MADFGEFLFQGQLIQLLDRQVHEQLDASRQLLIGLSESRALRFIATLYMRRIGYPPMRGGRSARPDRAGFTCCVIAYGKDEIDLRRAGCGELIPALAAQTRNAVPMLLQQLQRERIDPSNRLAARAVGDESSFAQHVEQHFAQDAARGMSGAQYQHVVLLFTHITILICDFNISSLP